jgi:cyanate lyase
MDPVRTLVWDRLSELHLDMADVSRRIGRNHSYLQQYFRRGVPRQLSEHDRPKLAAVLGLEDPEVLRLNQLSTTATAELRPTGQTRPPRKIGVIEMEEMLREILKPFIRRLGANRVAQIALAMESSEPWPDPHPEHPKTAHP